MSEDEEREYKDYVEARSTLLQEVRDFGEMGVKYGHLIGNDEVISISNMMVLSSGIINDGGDIFEFEAFMKYYTAKKIMETLSLKDIFDLRDRKLGKESSDKLLDDLEITREDLENEKGFNFDNYLPNDEGDDDDK